MESIIESVREYMAACPLLAEIPLKKRFVDWTDPTANNYGIIVDSNNLTAAVVPMVTVDAFDTAVSGYYPARKGKYAVEVSSCDDDDDMIIKGNFNGQGDEYIGWFDPANGKWSGTKPTAQASEQADTPAPESENE